MGGLHATGLFTAISCIRGSLCWNHTQNSNEKMQQMPLTLFPFEPFLIVSVVGSWDWLLVSYGGVLEEGKITHKEQIKAQPTSFRNLHWWFLFVWCYATNNQLHIRNQVLALAFFCQWKRLFNIRDHMFNNIIHYAVHISTDTRTIQTFWFSLIPTNIIQLDHQWNKAKNLAITMQKQK